MKKKNAEDDNNNNSNSRTGRRRVSKFIRKKTKIGLGLGLGGGDGELLELCLTDGRREVLEGMRERDAAFNSIIGFSSLQWQNLQIEKMNNPVKV